jgi:uncharacterized protein (DUF2147 family)
MERDMHFKWIVTVAAMLSLGFATMANAAGIDGQWARGDGNAKVRIAPCGSNICATNTWIKPGTPSEKAGDILTMTIKPVSDGGYSGTAFDPQRNLTYKISVSVKGDTMTTRGCVLAGLLCKDVNWSRIN